MLKTASALLLSVSVMVCQSLADGLEEPVPIVVAGDPLDVEHSGGAAPMVLDFDGDGKKDLIVGQQIGIANEGIGLVRLYLNQGRNDSPRFERFQYFSQSEPSRYLPVRSVQSATPQLVDLDGDGRRDLLTGTWAFEILLFRGLANGKFAAGEALKTGENKVLNVAYGVVVSAADWDGDGDLDLVAGGSPEHPVVGEVFLIRNEGTPREYKFAKPEAIFAEGNRIEVPNRSAAPCVADWDADGRLDLIIGCGDGSVRWYRNIGSRQAPAFGKFETLLPPPPDQSERGKLARPCVVDWNEDGRLDLLVGDSGAEFQKQLTDEDLQLRGEAKSQQAAAFTEWATVFNRYRQLVNDARDPTAARLINAELNETRNKLIELNAVRDRHYQLEQLIQGGRQVHGRVWLLLRK
jgi:hypothetical protein